MKHIMIMVGILLFFGTIACEKVDKAFEAVDKAKNLKAELEKTANEVKKDISGKAEALTEQAKKSADNLMGVSKKDDKRSEQGEKSQKENEKNKREQEDDEKD